KCITTDLILGCDSLKETRAGLNFACQEVQFLFSHLTSHSTVLWKTLSKLLVIYVNICMCLGYTFVHQPISNERHRNVAHHPLCHSPTFGAGSPLSTNLLTLFLV